MDLDLLDENLDLFVAKAELDLTDARCNLNHGIDRKNNPKATDYLCQKLGNRVLGIADIEIRIPICDECMAALYSNDWLLFYCVKCNSSQWLYKPFAKNKYNDGIHIIWLDVCPKCVTFDELDKIKNERKS